MKPDSPDWCECEEFGQFVAVPCVAGTCPTLRDRLRRERENDLNSDGMYPHCEHAGACLHLRRSGPHSLDGITVVEAPCHLPLCPTCADWIEKFQQRMLARRHG